MNDPIKQAIFDELNIILKEPGQKNEQRLQQLKFTESKKISNFTINFILFLLFSRLRYLSY